MKKIDCIIISTGRAASTAIYQYLNFTAGLALPLNKEPHYWCNIYKYKGLGQLLISLYVSDVDDYLSLYNQSKIILDASVGYFFCIKEVVDNLRIAGQSPKIIFLYREPVSRAASLFNEERKKSMVKSPNVLAEVKLTKAKGLWWENYYDNVAYNEVFETLKSNFENIICINQAALQTNGKVIIDEILNFLNLTKIREVEQKPINSSAEAVAIDQMGLFGNIFRLPLPFKEFVREKIIAHYNRKLKKHAVFSDKSELAKYLKFSLREYELFRSNINNEDIFLIESSKERAIQLYG